MTLWKVITPEATTNLVTNPSFETNTTGWTTGGTNTIARSDDQQWAGNYSLEVTYGNNSVLARHAVTLSTNTTYRLTARVRPAANWDGGDVEFAINGLTSATLTNVSQWTAGTDTAGAWTLLEAELVITSDGAGNIDITAGGTPTAGRKVHIDAVQIEAKTGYATTYCDGDQAGCVWSDKPHGSTSSRPATTRAGGKVLDLDSDLGFVVDDTTGAGVTRVNLITSNRSLLPGEEYQRTSVRSRLMTIAGHIVGTSRENYHSQRQALLRYFMPDSVPGDQPAIIQYEGAGDVKRLPVHYAGGMEIRGPQVQAEKFGIQLQATEPFWEGVGETAVSLGPTSATMRLIVGRVGGEWTVFGPPSASTYTRIYAIAVASPQLFYVGGEFVAFDGQSTNLVANVAGTWTPMTAPNDIVLGMALDAAGGLYIVGEFTNMDGEAAADNIAYYDGSSWSAVGTPSSGATITSINAVAIDPLTGNVWVGGNFTNLAGIAAADHIAYWDGTNWNAAGASGANNPVDCLTFSPDGTLLVGGSFTSIAGVSGNRIARRNANGSWSTMGSGFSSGTTHAIAITPAGGIYAAGTWATPSRVAQWTQGGWRGLGSGMDDDVYRLIAMPDGSLVALGPFTTAGGNALAEGVAVWDGGAWNPLPVDLPGSVAVGALARWGDDLYIGTDQEGTVYIPGAPTTATNEGTARAYPIIEASNAPASDPAVLESIENVTTGKRLVFKPGYAILRDQTLRIDLRPGHRRATLNNQPTPWPLAPGSDVAEFFLLPGDNELVAYASPATAPGLTIHVRWKATYWSVD